MEYHDVLPTSVYPVEHRAQVIERVVVTNHNKNIPRTNAQGVRGEVLAWLQIELVEFGVSCAALARKPLGDAEKCKEDQCERHSGNRGDLFFVNKLMMHRAKSVAVMKARPKGTSTPPNFRFNGTRNSRLQGCL